MLGFLAVQKVVHGEPDVLELQPGPVPPLGLLPVLLVPVLGPELVLVLGLGLGLELGLGLGLVGNVVELVQVGGRREEVEHLLVPVRGIIVRERR